MASIEGPEYPFYTQRSTALLKVRYWIAKESLMKAAASLEMARDAQNICVALENNANSLDMVSTEIGDDRPLSRCSFLF